MPVLVLMNYIGRLLMRYFNKFNIYFTFSLPMTANLYRNCRVTDDGKLHVFDRSKADDQIEIGRTCFLSLQKSLFTTIAGSLARSIDLQMKKPFIFFEKLKINSQLHFEIKYFIFYLPMMPFTFVQIISL